MGYCNLFKNKSFNSGIGITSNSRLQKIVSRIEDSFAANLAVRELGGATMRAAPPCLHAATSERGKVKSRDGGGAGPREPYPQLPATGDRAPIMRVCFGGPPDPRGPAGRRTRRSAERTADKIAQRAECYLLEFSSPCSRSVRRPPWSGSVPDRVHGPDISSDTQPRPFCSNF